MIPYASFLYFGISLYALIPAAALGFFKRFWKAWLILATALMLLVQYSDLNRERGAAIPAIALVLGYAILQYLIALAFLKIRQRGVNRAALYVAVGLSILPLAVEKASALFQTESLYVFLGISYITFRSVDVLLGVQDKLIKEINPLQYLTYLLFFPTISSGPIDRYRRFAHDWGKERTREEVIEDLDGGVRRIFTGFLYKFIVAVLIKQYWLDPATAGVGFLSTLSYMYAYFLYLFFDFAGYSAFAVGFSYIFGIHTPENFNSPFLSRDIRDFWNRWHMSLSFWFRDHIYNRFTFSALKGKWFKNSQTASYLGFMLTMGLMGVWHGLALHYIVYGLYHGALLVATNWLDRKYKGNRLLNDPGFFWRALSMLITFHLVAFSLLIFSGRLF
ncbi:MAG: D-alanyl-lipoteichoic acid biosynthesis protein DltB [Anaerolineales bacterium]|nr:D-alanyl-lipoteichoic acid biosynthesis protein DltB [Anaerolineales bacterium]